MTCKHCIEPDGSCLLPRLAIHGATSYPGYTPSEKFAGAGTEWCWNCGEGRPQEEGQPSIDEVREAHWLRKIDGLEKQNEWLRKSAERYKKTSDEWFAKVMKYATELDRLKALEEV